MSVFPQSFFTLVRGHFVSFSFFPLGIAFYTLIISNDVSYLTSPMKVLAGLNAGILCSGIMIVVFLEMFLAVF